MARELDVMLGRDGTLTWFVVPQEGLVEVRLMGEDQNYAYGTALALNARFFIRASKKLHHFPEGWAIYDIRASQSAIYTADKGIVETLEPVKYLYAGGLDAAHMWCLAHMMGAS